MATWRGGSVISRMMMMMKPYRTVFFAAGLLIFAAALHAQTAPRAAGPDTAVELSLPQALVQAREAGPASLRIDAERTIAAEQFRSAQASIRYGLDASLSASHAGSLTDRDARPSDSLGFSLSSSGGQGSLSLSGGLQAPTGVADPDGQLRLSATTLSGNYTLWDGVAGGRARASLEQSRLALEARMLTVESMYASLEDEVTDAWFTLEGAVRIIRVRELSLSRRQDESERTGVLRSVGEANRQEELQSRINLLDAEEALRVAERDVQIASRRLARLLGLPADTRIIPVAVAGGPGTNSASAASAAPGTSAAGATVPAPATSTAGAPATSSAPATSTAPAAIHAATAPITIPEDLDAAMNLAEQNRQEFASRRIAEAQSAFERQGIHASRAPQLRASASLSVPGSPLSEPAFDLNYSLGLTLSVPVFDRGQHETELRRFDERQLLDELAFEETIENIRREISAGLSALAAARHRLSTSELEQELAEIQYERTLLEYEDGSIGRIDLLAQSVAVTNAQIARERALTDVVLAERAVLRAVGEQQGAQE
ncbi:MAG: TolC family protein [Spirochaetaceae bacterium]|nr:MAG: TolC family protein [Spirochaetaceae bacterium]